mmetsp:Transcript_20270/g.51464  ORF Transcript_20270/g.51464 Transcript_20270/m.51464 type:complete len:411 (-) Transcript_20270:86-1318(-)
MARGAAASSSPTGASDKDEEAKDDLAGENARQAAEISKLRKEVKSLQMDLQQMAARRHGEARQFADLDLLEKMEEDSAVERLEYELSVAHESNRALKLELAEMDIVKSENARYAAKVEDLQAYISDILAAHAEEEHAIKKETFHSRIQLENTFRKTLQEMDRKHHEKAFQDMAEESKTALIDKAQLREELSLQTTGIEALTNRYLAQEKRLSVLKTDNSILVEHQTVQTKKIAALRGDLERLEKEAREHAEELASLKRDAERAASLEHRVAQLESQLEEANEKLARSQEMSAQLDERLARAKERCEQYEAADGKRQAYSHLTANSELVQVLKRFGQNASELPDLKERRDRSISEEGRGKALQGGGDLHNLIVSERSGGGKLKTTYSMSSLKRSEYSGILQSWKQSYSIRR